jgi:hypothetical protein
MRTSSVWRCVIRELRIHTALPVWVTWAEKGQARRELTCTLDVSRSGARLARVKGLQEPGQFIAVRRKTSEARFRVVWIGPPRTPYEGQVGVECVDPDKIIWDVDFADAHEDFEPIGGVSPGATRISASSPTAATKKDRSYACSGKVRAWADDFNSNCIEARVTAISWSGVELDIGGGLLFQGELLLQVQIDEAYLTFKGAVREHSCTWIEFRHIRRGDRQILKALIARLSSQ